MPKSGTSAPPAARFHARTLSTPRAQRKQWTFTPPFFASLAYLAPWRGPEAEARPPQGAHKGRPYVGGAERSSAVFRNWKPQEAQSFALR